MHVVYQKIKKKKKKKKSTKYKKNRWLKNTIYLKGINFHENQVSRIPRYFSRFHEN